MSHFVDSAIYQNNSIVEEDVRYYNIPRTFTVGYTTQSFENNRLFADRWCDSFIPEYLEFELFPHISIENFEMVCRNICLQFEIGGSIVLNIPLRFMIHLKKYDICDNKIYITIPFELFFNEIKLVSLQYNDMVLKLINAENTENVFVSSKLIKKNFYYDNAIRRRMAQSQYTEIVQQLSSSELIAETPINNFLYVVPFRGLHKGFYIECENVDEINEIKFILDDLTRLDYNRFLVRTKCVKINQHLLYLPLNIEKTQYDKTPEGFEGSINLFRINNCKLQIKLDNLYTKICIYGLGSNVLRYISGMCSLGFSNNLNRHIIQEYQPYTLNSSNTNSSWEIYRIDNSRNNSTNNIIYKLITNNNKLYCCITHEEILLDTRYMNCIDCNNNYNERAINEWFRQRPYRKTCPMCRANWSDYNIYINGNETTEESIEETDNQPSNSLAV
jgi:hypothetical protein